MSDWWSQQEICIGIIRYISHLYFSGMHEQILAVFDEVYSHLIKSVVVSTFKSLKKGRH